MKGSSITALWIMIVLCFCLIEFPGIFFINRIEPTIFHIPFLYWFPLTIWAILCILLFIGYKSGWKRRSR